MAMVAAGPATGQNPRMPDGPVVQQMFARVADRYDLANRLLSAGIDRGWRRAAVRLAQAGPPDCVLDVCSGTGDLAGDLARTGAWVVGSDFTIEMLAHARDKASRSKPGAATRRPVFVAGDTMNLPFPDGAFDLVTVAFGIRNVSDPLGGLREMARVTRPGGRVVVLEFCKPRVPVVTGLYLFYFRRILPLLGRLISGDKGGAYSYLPRSVMGFPERQEFLDLMRQAGLAAPRQKILTCGIAALYRAEVPA
jgi:demethylmenaquinone methyltransferase/2-methoxy-6-polyprenyl-1,4-benzoquinol methylase